MNVMEQLGAYGMIPVVVVNDVEQAVPLATALEKGGLPVMEITLRTQAGLDAIAEVRKAKPDFLLGAGTVMTLEQCKRAIKAGASYIVSPGFNGEIVDYCIANNVHVVPGCVTPTEIDKALASGLKIIKFFPANTYGGVNGCKALYGPYASTGIRFIPTGGTNTANLSDYADKAFIHAVGGSWLAPTDAVKNGDWDRITAITKSSIDQLLGFELAHIGINLDSEQDALSLREQFNTLFGWDGKIGNSSVFSGNLELLKSKGRGTMGHLAIRTNNVDRAIFYLSRRGVEIDSASISRKDGRTTVAYLKNELGGFAVHLLQK